MDFQQILKVDNSTISKIYGEFRQTFEYLYNSGFIRINPMRGVIKPKSEKEFIKNYKIVFINT